MLTDPLDLTDMHNLMARCVLVLTDSGGLQEEAPALGVPVLVLRGETERPEAVEAGSVRLAGTTTEGIFRAASRLLSDEEERLRMARAVSPYGDGHASERIADHIVRCLHAGRAAG
jgi:UDP-N-acetylglucosamine 2-epimerase (non-hydrolysing)